MWLRIPLQRPLFTYILLAAIAIIFVLMTLSGGSLNATEQERLLVMWGAKVNWLIAAGEWWRLITATFLHAGFLHIALNGYALFLIGTDLEALVGRARFAAIYFISGLAGSVASFTFSSMTGVGASGAIFGLIGALAVYYGLHRRLFGRVGQIQFWNIIAVIVLNVAFGFSGILPVDNSAHLGGLAAGMAVGYVLCPRYRPGRWLSPTLREVVNVNRGFLPWVAATLIAVDVVLMFVISLMLYRMGINLYLY
jgi:rhomboid protease GluP